MASAVTNPPAAPTASSCSTRSSPRRVTVSRVREWCSNSSRAACPRSAMVVSGSGRCERSAGDAEQRQRLVQRPDQRLCVCLAHRLDQFRPGGGHPGAIGERPGGEGERHCPAGRPDLGKGQREQVRKVGDPGRCVVVRRRLERNHSRTDSQRHGGDGRPVLDLGASPPGRSPRPGRGTSRRSRRPSPTGWCRPSGGTRRSGHCGARVATWSATGPFTPPTSVSRARGARRSIAPSSESKVGQRRGHHHQGIRGDRTVQRGVEVIEHSVPVRPGRLPGARRR